MHTDYSLDALKHFIAFVREKGLASKSTATGWQVAVNKVLGPLSEGEGVDVRHIDMDTAMRRFTNKNPGLLSPNSLGEYRRRVSQVIGEFSVWNENPALYKPRGATMARRKIQDGLNSTTPTKQSSSRPNSAIQPEDALTTSQTRSLSLDFPIRADFLARVVVPRDIKSEEARRLGAFLLTLAEDYSPAS